MLSLWRICLVFLLSNLTAAQVSAFNSTTIAATTTRHRASSDLSQGKVRIATSASGFDDPSTTVAPKETRLAGGHDIGNVISTLIGNEPVPTEIDGEGIHRNPGSRVHDEATEQGFSMQPAATVPTDSIQHAILQPTPVINNGQTLTPIPATKVIIGGETLTPGGDTVTVGEGEATKIHLEPNGAPVVEAGGSTSTAQLSSAPSQIFTIGDLTGTAEATEFQFLVASSTLAVGQTITVSGTVVALTTDAVGATVFVAGDSTTTVASPAPTSEGSDVQTTIVDGTTQYIIDSQTLAPGHPITVDGTAISLTYIGTTTIMVVGNVTTTMTGPETNTFTVTTGLAQATPGTLTEAGGPTTTSKSGGSVAFARWDVAVLGVFAFGTAVMGLG